MNVPGGVSAAAVEEGLAALASVGFVERVGDGFRLAAAERERQERLAALEREIGGSDPVPVREAALVAFACLESPRLRLLRQVGLDATSDPDGRRFEQALVARVTSEAARDAVRAVRQGDVSSRTYASAGARAELRRALDLVLATVPTSSRVERRSTAILTPDGPVVLSAWTDARRILFSGPVSFAPLVPGDAVVDVELLAALGGALTGTTPEARDEEVLVRLLAHALTITTARRGKSLDELALRVLVDQDEDPPEDVVPLRMIDGRAACPETDEGPLDPETPWNELPLSRRWTYPLGERLGVRTLRELASLPEARLRATRGIGGETLRRLASLLARAGLAFSDPPHWRHNTPHSNAL